MRLNNHRLWRCLRRRGTAPDLVSCAAKGRAFLVDCGASTLIGMRRLGLEPNDIAMVCITHLHGDHFGGLPWLLIDAQYVSKRTGR